MPASTLQRGSVDKLAGDAKQIISHEFVQCSRDESIETAGNRAASLAQTSRAPDFVLAPHGEGT